MREYLKNEIKHLPILLILFALLYFIGSTVNNSILHSKNSIKKNVQPNNSIEFNEQVNLGDAVSSEYACVSNYSTYNTRLTSAENAIGTEILTTDNKKLITSVNELNARFTNGVLPVENGGTGVTTAADARTAFDMASLSDLPSYSYTTLSGNGIVGYAYKYGKVVGIRIYDGTLSKSLDAGATILTIPSGYRPNASSLVHILSDQNGSLNTQSLRCAIDTAGVFECTPALSSGKRIRGEITYLTP